MKTHFTLFTAMLLFLALGSKTASAQNYGTFFGGTGNDYLEDIVLDLDGNIYVTGRTMSGSQIANTAGYDTSFNGGEDVYIAKFNKSHQLIWSTYLGGSATDYPTRIAFDRDSNLLVTGTTQSTDGMSTAGAYQETLGGLQDAFLAKYTRNGQKLYCTYLGWDGSELAYGLTVDNNNNYYLIGQSGSTAVLPFTGVEQTTNAGGIDVFLARFSSNGQAQKITYFGGTGSEYGYDVLVNNSGTLYLVLQTVNSNGLATPGAARTNLIGNNDLVVAIFDSSFRRTYSSYFGGNKIETGRDICFDADGNIYLVGQTLSDSGFSTTGAYQAVNAGSYDGYLAKFNNAFQLIWCTYAGGGSVDALTGVGVDVSNQVYLYGYTGSGSGLVTPDAIQGVYAGGAYDAFCQLYSSAGTRLWGTYLGGNNIEVSRQMIMGPDQSLYIAGGSSSTGGIPTSGAYQGSNNGFYDGYYYKFYITPVVNTDTCKGFFNTGFTVNKGIQCARDNQFVFTDTTTFSGSMAHFWDFGNGTFGSNQTETVHYDPLVNNQITVRLVTTLNGSCVDSVKQTVYLISSPAQPVITGNTPVYVGSRQTYSVPLHNGSTYAWFFDNGTGSSTNASIQIKWLNVSITDLKVVETSGGGCVSDTGYLQVEVKDPTGLEDLLAGGIGVYPNPAAETLYFTYSGGTAVYYTLLNTLGNIVLQGYFDNSHPADIRELKNGLYILMNDAGIPAQKILIQH